MRTELHAGSVLLSALLLAGCSTKVAPPIGKVRDIPPERGGVLRAAFYTDVRTLDSAIAFDTGSSTIEELIYDMLVNYDEHGKIVPQLAERIEVSPDGKRYTFPLRHGILFQDGAELKADDVKRSIERSLHQKTPCPVPSYYDHIEGYAAYHDGKTESLSGVKVDGDYQVTITLSSPDATFLHLMALPVVAPLCKSAGKLYDRNFSSQPCGAGPFKVVKFENGQIIKMVRHEGYWQKGKPYLDGIDWYLSMQSFTQRFKFEEGDLDYIRELSDADGILYRSDPAWKDLGEWESSLTVGGSFMNTEMPPFDNRHLRRAISFAVDREEVAKPKPGNVKPYAKMVPDALIPQTPDYPHQRYDYDQALEEMRLAGYPYDPKTKQGGYPEEIPYLALLDSYAGTAAEVHQQQLAKIGVKIRIQLVGWPTLLAKTSRRKTVPLGYAGWHADFPDPSTFFEPILSTKAIQEEESQNAAFFSNKELDALLEKARRSTDEAERLRLYRRAEEIVTEEAPWLIAYEYRYYELWQPYLHGYHPHPVLSQYLRNMWLDRDQKRVAQNDCWGGLPALERMCGKRKRGPRTTLALALGRRP